MSRASLELLRRTDKWYLGSGDGLIWAPPFPAWHDTPGFWDEAHLVQYPIAPLFAFTLLPIGKSVNNALDARQIPRARSLSWTPESITLEYRLGPGLRASEMRQAPGDRILVSHWAIINTGRRPRSLSVILWTAVAGDSVPADGVTPVDGGIRLLRTVRDRKEQELKLELTYRMTGPRLSWAAYRSEASGPTPNFALTPFYDRWDEGGALANEARLGGISDRGLVYVGLARRITIGPRSTAKLSGSVQITPLDLPVPARSGIRWSGLEGELPQFSCSDSLFTRYWWYRWYGLRLNTVPAGLGHYQSPAVCEGIGYFHQPISYSAMCHARELRWSSDPERAYGIFHTFFSRLAVDGSLPGRVYLNHLHQTDFYHADWGGAIADVYAVHPHPGHMARLYPQIERYAEWLCRTRDPEGSGMIDVVDQYETGQEYMSRYQAVDPEADRYGWENRLRLKGIDVTVYAYRLFRVLEQFAPTSAGRVRWRTQADKVCDVVRERMWDPAQQMFSDVNPSTGKRTGVSAAVCFYPYLTDIVTAEHVDGLGTHLFNPGEFWTEFPAPSSSVGDPLFSPDAEWKGKRHVCPWNGRVWPMTNSHLIDALARVTRLFRPEWSSRVVHFLRRFLQMMSYDGRGEQPNCFEHYHPFTGRGSVYRGIDDYQHSWVNDLIVRHLMGIIPDRGDGITVNPLAFGVNARLLQVKVAGHSLDVTVGDDSYIVRLDGKRVRSEKVGIASEIRW